MKGHFNLFRLLLLSIIAFCLAFGITMVRSAEGSEVIDSDRIWTGNYVVGELEDVLVKDCSFTVVDGNVTVYGKITLQNANIEFRAASAFGSMGFNVFDHGSLTLSNCTIAGVQISVNAHNYSRVMGRDNVLHNNVIGSILATDGTEVTIDGYTILHVEGRNASKIRISRSSLGNASVHDDSTMILEEVVGMGIMTSVNKYAIGYSPCPRTDLYLCSLNAVRVWGDGPFELNVAHSTINYLQTQGYTTLNIDNMTVTREWKHNGTVVCNRRAFDHIGNSGIEWGETIAACTVSSASDSAHEYALTQFIFKAETIREAATLSEPTPPDLLPTGNFINVTFERKYEGKVINIMLLIFYTEDQIKKIEPSTLKIYSYAPGRGWKPLNDTGVDEAGKHVWGNLSCTQEVFSACFAALGTPKSVGPPPTLAGDTDWLSLWPYIVAATIAMIVVLISWIYRKQAKG